MIISASRRTDLPAFYSRWFLNRIRTGYCTVPSPFNTKQVSYVSLLPDDVEVIVFWTRNPQPLLSYLGELTQRGYRYYFLFTLMDNPRQIDTKTPPLKDSLITFQSLADRIGPEKVIWRYDPIVLTKMTGTRFHIQTYQKIAEALCGYTHRSVISTVDIYRKLSNRLHRLSQQGIELLNFNKLPGQQLEELMCSLAQIAKEYGMDIHSCAEELDMQPYGILPGKCIDDDYIKKIFSMETVFKKDPYQRNLCKCVLSKDIGMYDSCLFGCQYCYANASFDLARTHYEKHDPNSPSLLGWYEAEPGPKPGQV